MNRYYDVSLVRDALTGSVPSVNPVFTKEGEIDWKKTGDLMDFMIGSGAKALLLTYGDSTLHLLTEAENLKFNRLMADVAGTRAMTISCGLKWAMPMQREFASEMAAAGIGIHIPMFPDWAGSLDHHRAAECFKEIGKIMPVMLLSAMDGNGLPLAVYDLLTPEDGVVAVKDDKPMPYGRDLGHRIRDKFAFLSGGTASMFISEVPYGADGYLSVFARCFPQVSKMFWNAYASGDMKEAVRLTEVYELPMMELWNKMHFDAMIHGMQELAGVGTRYRRAPYSELTDPQMEELAGFLKGLGIL